MPVRLDSKDKGFDAAFARLLVQKRDTDADVDAVVAEIIAQVRAEGDAALIELTQRFDRLDLAKAGMTISRDQIQAALAACPADQLSALEIAAARIRSYHERQLPEDLEYEDDAGVTLGHRWTAIDAVGIYVPGGLASYPSSVLMNAVPANVAGVERIAMVVPTPDGEINPLVLAAANLAGVQEIYRVGGAQAIAALAFGTETIPRVDKITGPGNAYVAAAKRQVFGTVGIDMIAGPSEILVVADAANDPAWIAADLLSQAEHDATAQSILITDDGAFATAVEAAITDQLTRLPRAEIAGASWQDYGAIINVETMDEAATLVNALAPEHLELAVATPESLASEIRHAGAIFMGRHTPEAIGDYVAGPNHVLPTARTARFSGPLSVLDFMKRTSLIRCSADGLAKIGPAAEILADAEGLDAHAQSIAIRLSQRRSDA